VRIRDYRCQPRAWMYVDETGTNDGQFIGASAIIVTTTGLRKIRAVTSEFKLRCLSRGIPATTEIHAANGSEIGQIPRNECVHKD